MKILLAVDGSHVTQRMLSFIAAHDELLGPGHAYTVVTVIAPIPAYALQFPQNGTFDAHGLEEAEKVFRPIRSFVEQQGWSVRLVHATGHPAETIATMAEAEHFHLVVMGSHGHSSLVSAALGSVASGVLSRCKTPLLLIR